LVRSRRHFDGFLRIEPECTGKERRCEVDEHPDDEKEDSQLDRASRREFHLIPITALAGSATIRPPRYHGDEWESAAWGSF
jgi:hypothetical protein